MQVYWFMLGWVVLFGILSQVTAKRVCVGQNLDGDKYESRANLFMAFITFAVIIFFAGARSYVADTTAYIKMFNDYPLFQNAHNVIYNKGLFFKISPVQANIIATTRNCLIPLNIQEN